MRVKVSIDEQLSVSSVGAGYDDGYWWTNGVDVQQGHLSVEVVEHISGIH